MWTKDQIQTVIRNPKVILTVTSAFSAASGAAVGYVVAQKRLTSTYEALMAKEIAEAKEFYGRLHKTDESLASPEKVLEDLYGKGAAAEALKSYQGDIPVTTPEEAKVISDLLAQAYVVEEETNAKTAVKNIFGKSSPIKDEWSYEDELQVRSENPDRPFIIHHDEFFENETEFEQESMTYFEGDDVLSDDRSAHVPDSDTLVGDDNLMRFGHGSKDKNVLYIRNEALEMEFEITRSEGKYSKEVLGFDDEPELKHSYNSPKKFRGHDE